MIFHLRAAGTSVLLDARGAAVPAVVHWGADLGDLDDAAVERLVDAQVRAPVDDGGDGRAPGVPAARRWKITRAP